MEPAKSNKIAYHFFACGRNGPPQKISFQKSPYRLSKLLKHDFFAATALYQIENHKDTDQTLPPKVILKIYRHQHLFGIPAKWLGKFLCEHEVSILRRLRSLKNVPQLLSLHNSTGFIYKYIEGNCLSTPQKLPSDFFDRLRGLTNQIHNHSIIYLDMNKKGNIIVGPDGSPFLIDFQISLYIDRSSFLGMPFSKLIFQSTSKADLYHILKHKKSLQPNLLSENEKTALKSKSTLVRLHRALVRPLKKMRRSIMRFIFSKKLIPIDNNISYHPEDDPSRFLK